MTTQKNIFISGAARGIGFATANYFVGKNWKVGIMDLNSEKLSAAKAKLGAQNCETFTGDVTNFESYQKAIRTFAENNGKRLNVLVNNAGITYTGPFEDSSPEINRKVIEVNLLGPTHGVLAALPYLKQTPGSKIINMSSASAIFGNPELTVYAGTKAGLKNMSEGWSIAFEKYDIGVSAIMPIYVKTKMVYDYIEGAQTFSNKDIKLEPHQIAKTIWKAAHSKKLIWVVGSDAKAYAFLSRLLPPNWIRKLAFWAMNYK